MKMSVLNSPYALEYLKGANPRFAEVIEATNKRCSCGESLARHKRCLGCGILVGQGHETVSLDEGLCWSCRRHRKDG